MNILPAKIEKAGNPTVVSHVGGRKATCRSRHLPRRKARRSASACDLRTSPSRPAQTICSKARSIISSNSARVYIDIGRTDLPLVAKLPGNFQVKRGEIPRLNAGGGDQDIFNQDGRFFLHWGRGQPCENCEA